MRDVTVVAIDASCAPFHLVVVESRCQAVCGGGRDAHLCLRLEPGQRSRRLCISLPHILAKLAEVGQLSAGRGRHRQEVGKLRSQLVELGQTLADFGQPLAEIGKCWPNLSKVWPIGTSVSRIMPNAGQLRLRQILANTWTIATNVDRILADARLPEQRLDDSGARRARWGNFSGRPSGNFSAAFGQLVIVRSVSKFRPSHDSTHPGRSPTHPNSGKTRPNSGKVVQNSAKFGSFFDRVRTKFDRFRPNSTRTRPKLALFDRSSSDFDEHSLAFGRIGAPQGRRNETNSRTVIGRANVRKARNRPSIV